MAREASLLGLLADLATDRDALIAQRDALKARNTELLAIIADLEQPPHDEANETGSGHKEKS